MKSASQGSLVKIEYDLEEDKDMKESKLMCVQEWDDGVKGFKGPHFALAFYCGKTCKFLIYQILSCLIII